MKTKSNIFLLNMFFVIVADFLILAVSNAFAIMMRFDFCYSNIALIYKVNFWWITLGEAVLMYVLFGVFRLYRFVWRAVGTKELVRVFSVVVLMNILYLIGLNLISASFSSSVFMISACCQTILFCAERFFLRFWEVISRHYLSRQRHQDGIMIIGGGSAGLMLLQEIETSGRISGKVRCIIDDNREKWGRYLEGVRIVGGREFIPEACEKYDIQRIIYAIPTSSSEEKSAILNICKNTGCKLQILPGVYEIVNGDVSLAQVKDIKIEDLLGREAVQLNVDQISRFITDRTVLVTGGGGSIGSEICRQIVRHGPKKLIIVDIYENNAYDVQQELIREYGKRLDLSVEIASIRDADRMDRIFENYKPQVVFHAAAHKHVPLMESCAEEAIKNNVFGTLHVVQAAQKHGVEKFVMISTDKAVNPTNLMGASKRLCEMIVLSHNGHGTIFSCVRFGNVLGSNGSVVPLFSRQIAQGGPITITDKRIIRYFMTIPEAAQLVLECGAMAQANQTFVLDMGQPVKILDLAENMIRLSGLVPYKDIDIREIGLRPGEKLYEELLIQGENLSKTANKKIFVEQQSPLSNDEIEQMLGTLQSLLDRHAENGEIILQMRRLVPNYRDPSEVNNLVQAGSVQ